MSESNTPPPWSRPDMRPTLNDTGFMFQKRDAYADDFIAFAGSCAEPVLEVGCAYGVATQPALTAGARVVACDLDQRHLDILWDETPPDDRDRLEIVQGQLPYVDFAAEHFGAILCSRVLHFLDGSAIDASVRKMFRWLKPAGRLYLVADTPYGIWRNFVPTFEAKLARGDRWPGLMIALENWLPRSSSTANRPIKGPPFMNLLVPELMVRCCEEAGFRIERSGFIDRSDFGGLGSMDGRENAGVLAIKPA